MSAIKNPVMPEHIPEDLIPPDNFPFYYTTCQVEVSATS